VPNPWQLYDALIEAIPAEVTVTAANTGLQWSRVTSSEQGIGMAYTTPVQTRPPLYHEPTFVGAGLRDIARLAKSWNLAEAGIGMAAINAFYSQADRARAGGFSRSADNTWRRVFHPYAEAIAGKTVVVVGHFPFAPEALAAAGELIELERSPFPGDFPDPACEYVLPDCDYAFISGSAFVNKTAPRLLALAEHAVTVVVGPSTPLSPVLFDFGVDVITGFVSPTPEKLDEALANIAMSGMHDAGYRVERHR
jgi:uncharacterized protein (DUF4213/DUF364 family)